MTTTVRGKVVAVTGGARGIGLATATMLHRLGAQVAIGDVDEVTLKTAATATGIDVYGPLDVTDSDSFTAFLDDVERRLGPIDVLVNNAGIMPIHTLVDEEEAITRRILDINVVGVILGSRLAAQRMLPRRRGHIVNIASLAGEMFLPGLTTYCASKHAVLGFTDSARLEFRGTGIDFSSVLPTFTNTELVSGAGKVKGFANAEPEDIARAVVSLIEKPRPRLRVTRAAGAVVSARRFMPARVAERIARAFGTEDAFVGQVDAAKRAAYEERIRR